MKKILIIILFLFCAANAYPQDFNLSNINHNNNGFLEDRIPPKQISEEVYKPILLLWPLNPMAVIENKKAYFALTKEVSIIFPRVNSKIGFEYSYVFRSDRNNHLRLFADYYYPIEAGDFAAVLVNIGGGYFTDTKKSGIFPQLSLSIIAPFSDVFSVNMYIKARQTFMIKKEEANIFDTSFGIGLMLFPY